MGVGYFLVNYSKKEIVRFSHIPASTAHELAGNPVSAAIITWYLLKHPGDQIAFVSDTYEDWPFPEGTHDELSTYDEMTDVIVNALITEKILRDEGILWADEDEPERVFIRVLRNMWMD
ncbi:MAG TPA: hypothetical protein PK530_04380 [Anaerolineales bacterium]|nr:hypothetical protein [Anaerolineales bacterium]